MQSCELCAQARARVEELENQNEVLLISAADAAATTESVHTELLRLLNKEASIVTLLNSAMDTDATTCAECAHWRCQTNMLRKLNTSEQAWVERFRKMSGNQQLQLAEALKLEKQRHSQLKAVHEELVQKKTDPFSKDAEMILLRDELRDAKKGQANANQTSMMANKMADSLRKELGVASKRTAALEAEAAKNLKRIASLEEIVDTYKRRDDLRDCPVAECQDLLCRKRALDHTTKHTELTEENAVLRNELETRKKQHTESSRKVTKLPAVVVANVFGTELDLNLRSFFTVFPGWSSEDLNDTDAFEAFVEDLHPDERNCNLKWMLDVCGLTCNEQDLVSSKAVRRCFTACMQALGGISRKKGSATIWLNVRQNRVPIFKLKN